MLARPPVAPEPSLEVELARSVQGVARYSLDPLAEPQPRRRFGRGARPSRQRSRSRPVPKASGRCPAARTGRISA